MNPLQDKERIAILATFAHEILMGAIPRSSAEKASRLALERTGLMRLESVAALTERPNEVERLRELAAACYAGLGAECDLPERWLDALSAAANGQPFSTEGLLPYRAERPNPRGEQIMDAAGEWFENDLRLSIANLEDMVRRHACGDRSDQAVAKARDRVLALAAPADPYATYGKRGECDAPSLKGRAEIVEAWNDLDPSIREQPGMSRLYFVFMNCEDAPPAAAQSADNFRGDNAALIRNAKALLDLDADGALFPHGIGGHARGIIEAFVARFAAQSADAVDAKPSAAQPDEAAERAAFEAWIAKDCGDLSTFGSGRNIHYHNSAVNNAWGGWKKRAAIAQSAAQQAEPSKSEHDHEWRAHPVTKAMICRYCGIDRPAAQSADAVDVNRIFGLADVHAEDSQENGNRVFDRGGLIAFVRDVERISQSADAVDAALVVDRYKNGNTALLEALMDMVHQHCGTVDDTLDHRFISANENAVELLEQAGMIVEGNRLDWDALEARKPKRQTWEQAVNECVSDPAERARLLAFGDSQSTAAAKEKS